MLAGKDRIAGTGAIAEQEIERGWSQWHRGGGAHLRPGRGMQAVGSPRTQQPTPGRRPREPERPPARAPRTTTRRWPTGRPPPRRSVRPGERRRAGDRAYRRSRRGPPLPSLPRHARPPGRRRTHPPPICARHRRRCHARLERRRRPSLGNSDFSRGGAVQQLRELPAAPGSGSPQPPGQRYPARRSPSTRVSVRLPRCHPALPLPPSHALAWRS